jgi:site-specific DNA recombinase
VVRQDEDCRELCAGHRWTAGHVYTDNDIGASTKTRAGDLARSTRQCSPRSRRGSGQVIVSYTNSRSTRRPLELERLITLHEKTGVLITTVRSGMDDLSIADGRMVARIKASVDAAEAERTAERRSP